MRILSQVGWAVPLALLHPRTVSACAVCFPGTDESQMAFILTTGILTFLPLALIGGTIYWINRRAKLRARHLLD